MLTKLTQQQHVFIATWLGLMFDGLDATICILALFPALSDLLGQSSHAAVGHFGGIVLCSFMAGWGLGAILFGWLSDRIGRVKSMLLTILLYALFTGLCASSRSWEELAIYRFLVGCGIGGEQMAGVVLLAETFKGQARIRATGILITAFGAGYILAGALNLVLGPLGWRWLFLAGLIPALLTLYLRSSVKESAQFVRHKAESHGLKDAHMRLLFGPLYLSKTLTICALASTAIVGYWAIMSWLPPWINQLTGTLATSERSTATFCMNFGSIASGLCTSFIVAKLSRKNCFRLAFAGALCSYLIMFTTVTSAGNYLFTLAAIAGFFSQLPFQLCFISAPELFPTHMRGLAVGFSVQFGRFLAAAFALFGGQIIASLNGAYNVACSLVSLFYLVGIIATFFMPPSCERLLHDEAHEQVELPKKTGESLTV